VGIDQALTWLGADEAAYRAVYELKSGKTPDPWATLIHAVDVLNNATLEELPDTLESVLAVDRWLWFLALENIFSDEDSYLFKGWDYQFYFDTTSGQIHPLEHTTTELPATASTEPSFHPIPSGASFDIMWKREQLMSGARPRFRLPGRNTMSTCMSSSQSEP
jgi:hypothetical protein